MTEWIFLLADRYLLLILLVFTASVIIINHNDKVLDYVISLFVASSLSEGLKYFLNIPRPTSIYPFEGASLPSTHTTLAFTSVFFYLLACHTLTKNSGGVGQGGGKKYFIAIILVLAFAVGITRVVLGAHTFIDVFAGIILGFVVSLPFKYYDLSGRRTDAN